eukprot:SAG31_NODE_39581_length_287_cov_0.819149_1_plen_58_part_01
MVYNAATCLPTFGAAFADTERERARLHERARLREEALITDSVPSLLVVHISSESSCGH